MECKRCLLNTEEVLELEFNDEGVCNYCLQYDVEVHKTGNKNQGFPDQFQDFLTKLKRDGVGKKYDTILGVSGGVDSSYLALKLKENGVRVLLYHYDNGWDSELAVKNIQKISQKLGFDLHTLVVDWNEFKDIQLSYLKAGVLDIEAITDHSAIYATKLVAKKYGIKNIVGGFNFVTESIIPKSWIYPNKGDWYNLRDIQNKFGTKKISTVPIDSLFSHLFFRYLYKTTWFSPLNLLHYDKSEVIRELEEKLDWTNYGGKHYESIWTRFYQGYILPKRYNIDKRKAHLSNLICSGQISKENAKLALEQPIYDPSLLNQDYEYVCKKFSLTKNELEDLLNLPKVSHYEYDFLKPYGQRYPFLKPLIQLRKNLLNNLGF